MDYEKEYYRLKREYHEMIAQLTDKNEYKKKRMLQRIDDILLAQLDHLQYKRIMKIINEEFK